MNPKPNVEKDLFAEALELPPDQREVFLKGTCRGDEPVRRRVALKDIKLGMDTKQVVARFEAKRQALACKLAKVAWHVMADDTPYGPARVFGSGGKKQDLGKPAREPVELNGHSMNGNMGEAMQGAARNFGDSTRPGVNARLNAGTKEPASHA